MNLCLNLALSWVGKRVFVPPTAPTAVSFQSLAANGTSGSVSTTQLTATFDIDPGLTTGNFVVTGASKGVVSKVDNVYTINIHTITVANGENVSLQVINPAGFSITPSIRFVAVNVEPASSLFPTPDYTQSWMSDIVTRPQDDDGWTILPISSTSRVMYASEAGDDGTATPYIYGDGSAFTDWFADEGQVAYRTHQAAIAQMREGENDLVLLRYGDSFEQTGEINGIPAGKSLLESHVISAYGDESLARPFIAFKKQGSNSNMFDNVTNVGQIGKGNNLIIAHIHASCTIRDPSSPDFAGWNNVEGASFYFAFTNGPALENTLIEDVRMDWFSTCINCSSVVSNFQERRNTFYRNYGGFAIGTYGDKNIFLQEENLFYHCGYYDRYDGTDNTFQYEGQFVDVLAATLSGAAETEVVFTRTLPTNIPDGIYIYVTTDADVEVELQIVSYTGSTVTVAATDFSIDNATAGNQVRVKLFGGKFTNHSSYSLYPKKYYSVNNVSINPSQMHSKNINDNDNALDALNCAYTGNLYVGGEIGLEARGNVASTVSPRFGNFVVANNVITNLGENKPTNRGYSWPLWFDDHDNLLAEYNWVTNQFVDADVDDRRTILLGGFFTNSNIRFNIFEGTESSIQTASVEPDQTLSLYGNAIDRTGYVESTRDINTYMADFHGGGTADDFAELLLPRRKGNWITLDREAHSYIKEGFRFTANGINIITQPVNQQASIGNSATFSVNAYIEPVSAYQWYLAADDSPIVGETSRALTITDVQEVDDGNGYYPIVSSTRGSTQANTANLEVIASRLYLDPKEDTDTSISFDVGASANAVFDGQSLVFKVITSDVATAIGGGLANNSTNTIRLVPGGNGAINIRSSFGFTTTGPFDITLPAQSVIWDGSEHIVEIPVVAGANVSAIVDGVTYTNATVQWLAVDPRIEFSYIRQAGVYYLYDIEVQQTSDSSVFFAIAVDSGITVGTEPATVGTGGITYNVDAADWTETPS